MVRAQVRLSGVLLLGVGGVLGSVLGSVEGVAIRRMGVVGRLLVVAGLIVLGRFGVVLSGPSMVGGGILVAFGSFLRHGVGIGVLVTTGCCWRIGFGVKGLFAEASQLLLLMSLRPQPSTPVPPQTRQVAQAAIPRGNRYLQLRDTLGTRYDDALFADLFPARG